MKRNNRKFYLGFTLVELMLAVLISSILVLVVGVLIVSGIHNWNQTYTSAHRQTTEDATAITLAFGNIGRMSNRFNNNISSQPQGYIIYRELGNGKFNPANIPGGGGDKVVSGDAVEFRYWDVTLDKNDTQNLMDPTKVATAYAFFYLDGGQLKVDYGHYPPGAVPTGGGDKNTSNIATTVLASNVSTDQNSGLGAFSHTTRDGIGKGCVRISVILNDPASGEKLSLMTSVLMRNWWPQK